MKRVEYEKKTGTWSYKKGTSRFLGTQPTMALLTTDAAFCELLLRSKWRQQQGVIKILQAFWEGRQPGRNATSGQVGRMKLMTKMSQREGEKEKIPPNSVACLGIEPPGDKWETYQVGIAVY